MLSRRSQSDWDSSKCAEKAKGLILFKSLPSLIGQIFNTLCNLSPQALCTSSAWNTLPPKYLHGTALTSFRFLLKCHPIWEDFAGYTTNIVLSFQLYYPSYPNLFLFLAFIITSLVIYLCFCLIILSSPLKCKLCDNRIVFVLLNALYP